MVYILNISLIYFLDQAVEKQLYGWFWACPNGEKCLYKHCLPPGFILKKDIKDSGTVRHLSQVQGNVMSQHQYSNTCDFSRTLYS